MSDMVERVMVALVSELGCVDGDMAAAARAAIDAMREPTDDMSIRGSYHLCGAIECTCDPDLIFRQMIDEAVKSNTQYR